jgi:D-amino peptidase
VAPVVLVSADMEGVTGAATPDDVAPGTATFPAISRLWLDEVNTVIGALLEHGAGEVVVTDAHGNGASLDPAQIDPRAGIIRGVPRRFGMLEGIDGGIDAVVFLGYHGTAGSGGVLSHAFMAAGIHALRVNGEPAGEGTINAHLAHSFGAPVLLVSGDEIACAEAGRYAPGAEKVITKHAIDRFVARMRPQATVRPELAAAARKAVTLLASGALKAPEPVPELRAEIEFSSENCALVATAIPGVQRTGPRSVSYTSADAPQWYRCLGAIWTMARAARATRYG